MSFVRNTEYPNQSAMLVLRANRLVTHLLVVDVSEMTQWDFGVIGEANGTSSCQVSREVILFR